METNLILEHGVTIKGKSLQEHLEVKGQEYALNFLSNLIKSDEDISIRAIREFKRKWDKQELKEYKEQWSEVIKLMEERKAPEEELQVIKNERTNILEKISKNVKINFKSKKNDKERER